jgi:hypothetical protein
MTLYKLGFIMDQHDWRLGLLNNYFVEVFRVEFQQNLCNRLWNIRNTSFMSLCKPDFLVNKYGWK